MGNNLGLSLSRMILRKAKKSTPQPDKPVKRVENTEPTKHACSSSTCSCQKLDNHPVIEDDAVIHKTPEKRIATTLSLVHERVLHFEMLEMQTHAPRPLSSLKDVDGQSVSRGKVVQPMVSKWDERLSRSNSICVEDVVPQTTIKRSGSRACEWIEKFAPQPVVTDSMNQASSVNNDFEANLADEKSEVQTSPQIADFEVAQADSISEGLENNTIEDVAVQRAVEESEDMDCKQEAEGETQPNSRTEDLQVPTIDEEIENQANNQIEILEVQETENTDSSELEVPLAPIEESEGQANTQNEDMIAHTEAIEDEIDTEEKRNSDIFKDLGVLTAVEENAGSETCAEESESQTYSLEDPLVTEVDEEIKNQADEQSENLEVQEAVEENESSDSSQFQVPLEPFGESEGLVSNKSEDEEVPIEDVEEELEDQTDDSEVLGNNQTENIEEQKAVIESQNLAESIPRLQYIMNELVSNEEIYVRTLELGIKNYAMPMDNPDVPQDIREAKSKIFGNITEIYEFHANTFYPTLVLSGCDILKISKMFDAMVANGNFYCYVLFAFNREQSSKLCETYGQYFQDLQKAAEGDRLGVGSFLLQPIQRLPRYQLLLNELIKELMKNFQVADIKQHLGAVCKTEKNFAKMVMLFNESLAINEIASCDSSIDLFNIGQFRKIGTFAIYDHARRRRYTGKLLYFDQCLVYTESINRRLEYRGHFGIKEFGLFNYDANEKFCLCNGRYGEHEVDFGASISQLEEWHDILHKILMDYKTEETVKLSGWDLVRQVVLRTHSLPN